MKLKNFDHIVLTTGHLEECLHFYREFLDMTVVFDKGRYALLFGNCKINIHQRPGEFQPAAAYPVSGSIDLCIITETPMEKVRSELLAEGGAGDYGCGRPSWRQRAYEEHLSSGSRRQSHRNRPVYPAGGESRASSRQ